MEIRYFKNYEVLSKAAADIVAAEIKNNANMVLGLPTGSTPVLMYNMLSECCSNGELDFSGVSAFNLDEYYPIKRSNSKSYHYFMREKFFNHINIKPENTFIPNGEAEDVLKESAEYDKKIAARGGIDLMILGLGQNGHIGFNEPAGSLVSGTHAVDLTEKTRQDNSRFFDSVEDVPTKALTMGMGSILKCKKIMMLVSGDAKRDALKDVLSGKITTTNPGTFLNLHPNVLILTDINI